MIKQAVYSILLLLPRMAYSEASKEDQVIVVLRVTKIDYASGITLRVYVENNQPSGIKFPVHPYAYGNITFDFESSDGQYSKVLSAAYPNTQKSDRCEELSLDPGFFYGQNILLDPESHSFTKGSFKVQAILTYENSLKAIKKSYSNISSFSLKRKIESKAILPGEDSNNVKDSIHDPQMK